MWPEQSACISAFGSIEVKVPSHFYQLAISGLEVRLENGAREAGQLKVGNGERIGGMGMTFWIGAAILQLLVLVVLVVGPYIGLYGREDQREG